MNDKKYDLVVFIGRFQPFHKGHRETVRVASNIANNVLVLIGSANGPRTIRNPWTYDERSDAIQSSFDDISLYTDGLNDYSYNDNEWIQQVGEKITKTVQDIRLRDEKCIRVAVIGHDKDHSSYYLNYFPQWEYIEMPAYPEVGDTIDSTKIRQLMFTNQLSFVDGVVPGTQVRDFLKSDVFEGLQKEWDYVEAYKKAWKAAPYEPTFVTADAVVEQSGHILLIQRNGYPGKGLWAMPGGFVDPGEKLKNTVLRELREETRLKVPEKVLRGSIAHQDYFDDPNRSTRGRTITHAFLFQLDNAAVLPKVKGNEETQNIKWVSLAEFETMQGVMFEDHYSIIKNMLSRA